ncbi:hypothetical protein [Pontiella agarivorans]|uniref:Uncharacterized protein n=1 Tax=Pontiella agarivorans TaxID=3038953 RepID=A0ABU5N0N3_9BACT|nr:hypothetical protein [Pontiella agarivorans]MDZ8120005.1 hypothetical protein [Pontiella agarivorans]
MKKWIIASLAGAVALGTQANIFKPGFTDNNTNNIDWSMLDTGWQAKDGWSTNATGLVMGSPGLNYGIAQVVSIDDESGDLLTLNFDWTPANIPSNTQLTVKYQLIGWNEVSPASSGNFFTGMNFDGRYVDTLGGTHERVDLVAGSVGSTNGSNMGETDVTASAPGVTESYSATFNIGTDISEYEFVGIRIHIDGGNTNTVVGSTIENISLTASDAPPNMIKSGLTDNNSNSMDWGMEDTGWQAKDFWTATADGLVHDTGDNWCVAQVNSISNESGSKLTFSFDWTPTSTNAWQLNYQLIGWQTDGSESNGSFFNGMNFDGRQAGVLDGAAIRVVDLTNGNSFTNKQNQSEIFVTASGQGITTNYSVTFDISGYDAAFNDISKLDYFGIRFHIDGIASGDATAVGSTIENITLVTENSGIEPGYGIWAAGKGVTGSETDDDDGDGLSNRGEYIFGGDPVPPNGALDQGTRPTFDPATGAYQFSIRNDNTLNYYVLTNLDLVNGSWGTNAGPVSVTGNDGLMGDYTNMLDTVESKMFIKLLAE